MNLEFKPQQLPAFPVKMKGPGMFAGVNLPAGAEIEWAGMTLRDYFAAKAMEVDYKIANNFTDPDWRYGIALDAYKMADAMLEARK